MIDRVKSPQSRALALTPEPVTESTQLTAPTLMIVTTGFEKEGNLRGIRARLLRRRQNELFSIPRACSYSSRLLPELLTSYPTTRKQRQTAISERLSTPG